MNLNIHNNYLGVSSSKKDEAGLYASIFLVSSEKDETKKDFRFNP